MSAPQDVLDRELAVIRELSGRIAALVCAVSAGPAAPTAIDDLLALTDQRLAAEARFDAALAEVSA